MTQRTDLDITGDGEVNQLDLDELVPNICATRYGDIYLDGDVDTIDFEVLAINLSGRGGHSAISTWTATWTFATSTGFLTASASRAD